MDYLADAARPSEHCIAAIFNEFWLDRSIDTMA
jgi:hypothetical protein